MTQETNSTRREDPVAAAVDTAAGLVLALADQPGWSDRDRARLADVAAVMVAAVLEDADADALAATA